MIEKPVNVKTPQKFQPNVESGSKFKIALLLLVLLVSIYSLTYSGTFVTDDEHILASRTLSLAFDDNINDTRVFGNSRVFALASLSPEQAGQALNIEPGQEFLGAILARLSVLLHTGRVQTMFLLNIWVTALTAVVLFSVIAALGYSTSTALIVALLFGLCTIAWPYSRTYFRDSLAMLFLTLAWACTKLITARKDYLRERRIYGLVWVALPAALIAGILTKNTVAIAVPIILIELAINSKPKLLSPFSIKSFLGNSWKKYLFFIAIALVLLAFWFFVLPGQRLLARFTPEYYRFLINFFFNTPHPNFWGALAGPFVSPGKSIFLFSPILVLSLLGFFHDRKSGWAAWAYLILLIIAQALFYDKDWWGHINWGLRFTLPAIPLLILASVPVIDRWTRSAKGRIGLITIGVISALVQLVGLLPPMIEYYIDISNSVPKISDFAALWNPKYSALLWHLKWILAGKSLDLAAVRIGISTVPVVIGFCSVILLVIPGLKRFPRRGYSLVVFTLSIGLTVYMLISYKNDPAYYRSRPDLETAQEKISEQFLPDDLILVKSYGTPAWYYWMNWTGASLPWTSLPFHFPAPSLIEQYNSTHDPEVVMYQITLSLLKQLPGPYRRVWIVLPGDSPGADLNVEVDWLETRATSSGSWTFSGNEIQTRLYLFDFSSSTSH